MDVFANTDDELTCRELVELVTDYLEQALAEPERLRFEAHLTACEGCRDYLDQMRRTVATLGRRPPQALGAADRAQLLALFHSLQTPAPSRPDA